MSSTFDNLTVTGKVTQGGAATAAHDLIRLAEAQALVASLLQGDWASGNGYTAGQLVVDDNRLWLCRAPSLNQKPANFPAAWTPVLAGGTAGAEGKSVYVAYDTTGSGNGFSLTPAAGSRFVAFKPSATPLTSAEDFAGVVWSQMAGDKGDPGSKGDPGAAGAASYLYVGYAADASGNGFNEAPGPGLGYIAFKVSATPLETPVAADFAGLWKQYVTPLGSVAAPLTLAGGVLGLNASYAATPSYVVQRDASGNLAAVQAAFTSAVIGSATLSFSAGALRCNTPFVVSGLTVGALSGVLKCGSGNGVVAGDATANDLPEGAVNLATPSGNPYFTRARVLATPLTGLASTLNILATDTLLAALAKLDAATAEYALLTGATFAGAVVAPSVDVTGSLLRLRTAHTPANSSESGNAGELFWDATYLYLRTGPTTVKRIAWSAF